MDFVGKSAELNSFNPYHFFTNEFAWNFFSPENLRISGNNTNNVFLKFFFNTNGGSTSSDKFEFTIEEFEKFCKDKRGIKKDVVAELELKLFRKNDTGKMIQINENELGNFRIGFDYDLNPV